MPETPEPTLTGYYDSTRSVLWTVCRHCRTWQDHAAPGVRSGRYIDRCGRTACRPDCPLRTSWYRIRVSPYSYAEAAGKWQ